MLDTVIDRRNRDAVMGLGEHLEELRRRLIYALAGVAPVLVGAFVIGQPALEVIIRPLQESLRRAGLPGQLQTTGTPEMFGSYVMLSFIITLAVSAPWVVWQLWLFVAPGLYSNEKRFAYLLAPLSMVMTVLGTLFLYFIMLPVLLGFLVTFGSGIGLRHDEPSPLPPGVTLASVPVLAHDPIDPPPGSLWVNTTLRELRVCVAPMPTPAPTTPPAAGSPQTPESAAGSPEAPGAIATAPAVGEVGGAREVEGAGAVGSGTLPRVLGVPLSKSSGISVQPRVREYVDLFLTMALGFCAAFQMPVVVLLLGWAGLVAPAMLSRYRRHVVVACTVLGAVLTPSPDPFSMMLLAGPLYVLYELGVLLLRLLPASRVGGGRVDGGRAAGAGASTPGGEGPATGP